MKILLIGHSIIDHFEELGDDFSKPGGLFYSALGILSIANPEDEIFLLTSISDASNFLFRNVYSKINLEYADMFKDMPEVILKTSGSGEREEVYKNLSAGLSINQVKKWNQFDGILINMITGFDISYDQLKEIRKKYSGKIYMDVHTLSRGIDKNMKRKFRPIPHVEEWLTNIDILQCNEMELKSVSQKKTELECVEEIFQFGPRIVIVTKGEKGTDAYVNINGKTSFYNAQPKKINNVNKVGCGDIFGAVFFYLYISTGDVKKSLDTANKAGALTASTENLEKLSKIILND